MLMSLMSVTRSKYFKIKLIFPGVGVAQSSLPLQDILIYLNGELVPREKAVNERTICSSALPTVHFFGAIDHLNQFIETSGDLTQSRRLVLLKT